MKIGFNFKKIINAFEETINYLSTKVLQNENNIANHETRITTLENNSGGGGSGIGLENYTLKLNNISGTNIRNFNCKKLDDKVFLDFHYNKKLSEMDKTNISNKYIKIGTVTLGNNDNDDMFDCTGYLPCYYLLGTTQGRYSGLIRIYKNTLYNNNSIEIIINNEDIEKWNSLSSETYINIYASGIINTSVKSV